MLLCGDVAQTDLVRNLRLNGTNIMHSISQLKLALQQKWRSKFVYLAVAHPSFQDLHYFTSPSFLQSMWLYFHFASCTLFPTTHESACLSHSVRFPTSPTHAWYSTSPTEASAEHRLAMHATSAFGWDSFDQWGHMSQPNTDAALMWHFSMTEVCYWSVIIALVN